MRIASRPADCATKGFHAPSSRYEEPDDEKAVPPADTARGTFVGQNIAMVACGDAWHVSVGEKVRGRAKAHRGAELVHHHRGRALTVTAQDDADDSGAYHVLHEQLSALWAAPVQDMAKIDALMKRIDDVHARFKAAQRVDDDPQRY